MSKTVLITGATSGIGEACALLFAQNGYRLILVARRAAQLNSLAEKLTKEYATAVHTIELDVRDRKKVTQAIDALPSDWKQIDLLINNAGLAAGLDPIQNGNIDDWDAMMDTNVKGLLYISKAVIPLMIAQEQGHIINIGSIAGKETYANGNVYCASKAAVDALSRGMRIDLLPHHIKVTAVHPGAVETEFSVVRFKGDTDRAKNVYKGFVPLRGEDIAATIFYCATLPEHVCINDLVIMPTAQANAGTILRKA